MTLLLSAVILYGWQIAGIFFWRLLGSDRACCQSLRLGLNLPDYAIWKNTNTHIYAHCAAWHSLLHVRSVSPLSRPPTIAATHPENARLKSDIKYKTIIAHALMNELYFAQHGNDLICPNVNWQIRHVSRFFFLLFFADTSHTYALSVIAVDYLQRKCWWHMSLDRFNLDSLHWPTLMYAILVIFVRYLTCVD